MILGMAMVTYLPRYVPFFMITRLDIPKWMDAWLKYLPVSILSTLVITLIVAPDGRIELSLRNPYLLASLSTIIVAKLSSNLIFGILTGMIAYWFINAI
jgi:branched-subunit amino acid transport protein